MKILLFCAAFFSVFLSFGQEADVSGIVYQIDNGQQLALPNVLVSVENTTVAAITDQQGGYTLRLPAGTYSIVFTCKGFVRDSIGKVVLSSGQSKTLDMTLEVEKNIRIDKIVIKKKFKDKNKAVIDEIKKSDNVVVGVSTAQIQKTQDRDASEVVRRIPGVTVIDRFITIRGLNDRYTSVWLNDAAAPGAETDKRAFSFDIIPAGLIEKILIFKTPSAELPGDFAGGMVKIYTTSIPDKTSFSFDVKGSYRDGSTFGDFKSTQGSSTDWLGFDNKFRALPSALNAYVAKGDVNNSEQTKSFKNTWATQTSKINPDFRINMYYNQVWKIKNLKMGNTLGVNYSSVQTAFQVQRQDWDSVDVQMDYFDQQFMRVVRTNILENFAMEYKGWKIELKNLLNQSGTEQTVLRNGQRADAPDEKAYMYSYQDKLTYTGQFTGKYSAKGDKFIYDWSAGYSLVNRNDPDLRRIRYTKNQDAPDSMYKAQVANVVDPVNGGGRFYSTLTENVFSFNHSLKMNLKLKEYAFTVTAGSYFEQKNRAFAARILGYTIAPGMNAFAMTHLSVDKIFADQNVGVPGGFKIDEITSASDKYNAQNRLIAGFTQLALPLGNKIKVVTGLRYEYNQQSLQSHVNLDSVHPSVTTEYLLPSANASYNFNSKSLMRVAYGKTLNRPEFREWSPFFFYDFNFNAGTYGSLFPTVLSPAGNILQVAEIQNYDLRYEYYSSSGELVHLGAFYKSFINPIQQVVLASGGDSRSFTFINGESAYARGIEFDVRKNLVLLDTVFQANFFSNLSLVANVALTSSALNISKTINQSSTMPLQGQSPYIVNAGLYYQNDSIGFQINVLYNVFGPRVFLLGTLDYPSIGELSRNTLDISMSKTINKHFSLNLGIQDVLNNPVYYVQDTNKDNHFSADGSDKLIMKFYRGPYATLGIKGVF